jgi:hypothetical protein
MPPTHSECVSAHRSDRGAAGNEAAERGSRDAEITLSRTVWERQMRNLRIIVRLLAIVLVVLVARALLSGATLAVGVAGATVAVLLLAALGLARQGRRLEPDGEPASADTAAATRSR